MARSIFQASATAQHHSIKGLGAVQQQGTQASPSLSTQESPELSPHTAHGRGTQLRPCPMAARPCLAPAFPKRSCLEPGSRWQLSPCRPGSPSTSPGRAARSRPALRPGQFITPVPPGTAGHGAATSLTAHPSAPQAPGTRGSSAPSPAPGQGTVSLAHPIVTPHVTCRAGVTSIPRLPAWE